MVSLRPALSAYRMAWLYAMFDLPVGTPAERKAATKFRLSLLDQGFEMAQYSVYLRFAESREIAETYIESVSGAWPGGGSLHIVTITDKQYANARVFAGEKRVRRRGKPGQLILL